MKQCFGENRTKENTTELTRFTTNNLNLSHSSLQTFEVTKEKPPAEARGSKRTEEECDRKLDEGPAAQ